ncbi:MAG: carboxypeptidase M32 [Planctomycetota bacterium]
MKTDAYQTFLQYIKEVRLIDSIQAVLEWDQQTFMPRNGAALRAEQVGLLASLSHQKLIGTELGELLARVELIETDDPAQLTNIREMRRLYDRAVKLPTELVRQIAHTATVAGEIWQTALADSDFPRFAPHLEQLLTLKQQVADHIGWDSEPYDALMDEFEPGARATDVQRVFDEVKQELVPLAAALSQAPRQPDHSILDRVTDVNAQAAFCRAIAADLGFDFEAGRIDLSTHPFCTGFCPRDVRLTARYRPRGLVNSLFGVIHETGHGLYEQGLDPQHSGTPMANSVSLGIHESQSRMWENLVGRGHPFWQHYFPRLQAEFPVFADLHLDDWFRAINAVQPSCIRVEADEVTYGLHIMLRFNLERRMVAGQLAVKDIPEAWNSGMRELLGVTPPNDAAGCLQDIHWSMGVFGYFPTYQLGNLYAAQFFQAARRAIPELEEQIARGEFMPLRDWLHENIHRHGQRYRATELVEVVSGVPLSHRPFVDTLGAKLKPLYGL